MKMFTRDEEGATLIEYALLASLIAAVCYAVVVLFGHNVSTLFGSAASSM